MKTLKHFTILIILLTLGFLNAQESQLHSIEDKYNPLLKDQNKGVAVLIKKNNVIHTLSLGSFGLNENSVFNIGSATKTFTSILLLQEFEKGNLNLTDSIGKYLTPIKNVNSKLTVEDLLTHESGLNEVIGRNIETIFYSKNDSLYNQNLLHQIGENDPDMVGKYDYCNTNYFLLGKIIEKVTDQNYFDLLRERIFEPLKMDNTYPYLHKNLPNLATPYYEDKVVKEYLDYRYFANIAYAAGSIASTLIDMENFYHTLYETEVLLKTETLKLMLESGNEFYGLGIMKHNYDGKKHFGHGGNNIGYAFRNEYNPETKNLVLMFTNSDRMPLNKSLRNDVFAFFDDKGIEEFNAVNLDAFKGITGKYLLKEANLVFEIIQENNKLFLVAEAQGIKSELTQKSETTLYDTTVGATLTKNDEDTNSLVFSQNGFETTISRINN